MRIIDVNSRVTTFAIGREGENEATQVRFDYVELFEDTFGPGVCELLFQRPREEEPYAVPLTLDGGKVIWTVSDTDTDIPGRAGKAVLHYYVGDTLAKSHVWMVTVLPSLGAKSETPPEKFDNWLEQILRAGADAEGERIKAEQAADDSEKSAVRSEQSAVEAAASEENAATHEKNAGNAAAAGVAAANAASQSAAAAKLSEQAAKQSEQNAALSEGNAKTSEGNAKQSAEAAALSAKEAKASEEAFKQLEDKYTQGAEKAAQNAEAAQKAAEAAAQSQKAADLSEQNAKTSEGNALTYAKKAEEVVGNAAWIDAEINEDGHLIVTHSDNFNGAEFSLNEDGHLEVMYT